MNAMTRGFEAPGPVWSGAPTPSGLAGMMRLALAIRDLMEDEGEEGRVAIACAVLNRMRRFGPDDEDGGPQGGAAARAPDVFDPVLCRALAVACLVLSGDLDDPTDGATHFHRHTEQPGWARRATPKALIGRHIFYVLEARPGV